MSSSSDDSSCGDFEAISVSTEKEDENSKNEKKEMKNKVQVVLPSELLQPNKDSSEPTVNQDSTSETSSFVPVQRLNALGISSKRNPNDTKNDDDTASVLSSVSSSWSRIHKNTTESPSCHSNNNVSDSNSVISGFDCLDIGGYSMRKCHLDGYMNQEGAVICQGCGAALVANPCIDADLQIALNLQRKEETEAWQRLQYAEKKRKLLPQQSPMDQAHQFTHDVTNFVTKSFAQHGYQVVPAIDLQRLAREFLEYAKVRHVQCEGQNSVFLGYTFTSKADGRVRDVQRRGFQSPYTAEPSVRVFYTASEAFDYRSEYDVPFERAQPLFVIQEQPQDHPFDEDTEEESEHVAAPPGINRESPFHRHNSFLSDPEFCVGWIVAVSPGPLIPEHSPVPNQNRSMLGGHSKSMSIKKRSGPGQTYYDMTTVHGAHATLPLVCFDASLRFSDTTVRLHKGLQNQVVSDFMNSILPQVQPECLESVPGGFSGENHQEWNDSLHQPKRPKVGESKKEEPMVEELDALTLWDVNVCTHCHQIVETQLPCSCGCKTLEISNQQDMNPQAKEMPKESTSPAEANSNEGTFVEEPLPTGWNRYWDPSSNRPYYHNTEIKITTWDHPGRSADEAKKRDQQETPLPPGWNMYWDAYSKRSYYHNANSAVSTWELPSWGCTASRTKASRTDQHETGQEIERKKENVEQSMDLPLWLDSSFLADVLAEDDIGDSKVPASGSTPAATASQDNHESVASQDNHESVGKRGRPRSYSAGSYFYNGQWKHHAS